MNLALRGLGQAAMIAFLAFRAAPVSAEDDPALWPHSLRVTVNTAAAGADISGDVSAFPLLVRLDSSRFDFSKAAADGSDLRVVDADKVFLPIELARWRPDLKQAELWVHVPKVRGAATQHFNLLWGRSGLATASKGAAVFAPAQGWRGVWHLDGFAPKQPVHDATGNGYAGLAYAGVIEAPGVGGSGLRFAGGTHRVSLPAAVTAGLKAFTISLWVKESKSGACAVEWSCPTLTGMETAGIMSKDLMVFSKSGKLGLIHGLKFLEAGAPDDVLQTAIALDDGAWHHVAIVYEGTRVLLYEGGTLRSTSVATGLEVANHGFDIANIHWGDESRSWGLTGDVDEYHVTSQVRNADWIKLSYETQRPDGKAVTYSANTGTAELSITSQPKSITVQEGKPFSFTVAATSSRAITYQWHKDGQAIFAAVQATFSIPSASVSDAGAYHCVVSDGQAATPSSAAALTVTGDASLWARSMAVTVNTTSAGANVAEDVTDFPLLIRLGSGFDFAGAAADGADIRFQDGTGGAFLGHEMVRWRPDLKQAEVWVRLPKVKGNGLQTLTMLWGRPGAASASSGTAAFPPSQGWRGVWHLEGASGSTAADATGNGFAGTVSGATGDAAGVAGKAFRFATERDRIALPSAASERLASFTILLWAKENQAVNCDINWMCPTLTGFSNAGLQSDDFWLLSKTGKLGVAHGLYTTAQFEQSDNSKITEVLLNDGKWHHVSLTYDGSLLTLGEAGKPLISLEAQGGPLAAGGIDIGNWHLHNEVYQYGFRGDIDEYQMTSKAQSAAWIKLAYETQRADGKAVTFGGANVIPNPGMKILPIPGKDTLSAGDTVGIGNGRIVFHPGAPGSPDVVLEIQSAAIPLTAGFDHAGPSIKAYPLIPETAFSGLEIRGGLGATENVFLYRVETDGTYSRVSPGTGGLSIPAAWEYIPARDTAAPNIRWLGSSASGKDSLRFSFRVADNVSNLHARVHWISGRLDSTAWVPCRAGDSLALSIPLPSGPSDPVEVLISATDHASTGYFPRGGARAFTVGRPLPSAAPIAFPAADRWILAGIPADPAARITPAALAEANGGSNLHVAVWVDNPSQPGTGAYRRLEGGEALPAGKALWMAAGSGLSALGLPALAAAASDSTGTFPLSLAPGWNLVANPSLRALPWPISRAAVDAYTLSNVKGLHAQDGEGYAPADTLLPWKGYFVFNHGGDTVLHLGKTTAMLQKSARPSAGACDILISGSSGSSLRLGARAWAADGFGREDDLAPPSRKEGHTGLWSSRQGRALSVDYVRGGEGVAAWTVVSRAAASASLRLDRAASTLPPGWQVWAAFPSRGLRMRADDPGVLPMAPEDTALLYAGPPSLLAKVPALSRLAPAPADFRHAFRAGPRGLELRLALPSASRIMVRVHRLDGVQVAALAPRLLQAGWHVLDLAGTPGPASTGVLFAELSVQDGHASFRRVEKISP